MRLVVPTAASLAVPSGIILISTFRTRKWVRKDVLLMMIAGVVVGMPLGTYVANSWQCATLFYIRLINADVLRFVLYMLPAFIIGNLIGSVLHIKTNQALFDKIVALVLLVAGLFLMIPRSMS